MIRGLSAALGTALFVLATLTLASARDFLLRDERLCDQAGTFCLHGTFTYEPNPRLLHLSARVQKAPGPGILRIVLTGSNRLGHPRLAPFEVQVRGRHSEIINHKMIPDHPDVREWSVEQVEFITDDPS